MGIGDSSLIVRDGKHFIAVGVNLARTPLQFRANDWKKVGLITGSTALLFFADKDIQHFAQSHQNPTNNRLFNFDQYYGNGYTAAMTVGVYGFGYIFHKPSVRKAGLQSMEALFYSGMITGAIKVLLGRRRPYGGDSHLFFKPLQLDAVYESLPSGHTTVSFAVSTVMAKSLDNPLWKTFWYGSAGMVAASRVYHNAHWFSDIFLGGVIGYSVANFIVKLDEGKPEGSNLHIFKEIYPYFSNDRFGLQMYF
ncbi:MAG: phosphatase PAP2 family protein [Calditrichaeota bacterium]|nr:phosphatase PAP2 family protein [Calditrichota bacterium]